MMMEDGGWSPHTHRGGEGGGGEGHSIHNIGIIMYESQYIHLFIRNTVYSIMLHIGDWWCTRSQDHRNECTHCIAYQSPYSHPSSRLER